MDQPKWEVLPTFQAKWMGHHLKFQNISQTVLLHSFSPYWNVKKNIKPCAWFRFWNFKWCPIHFAWNVGRTSHFGWSITPDRSNFKNVKCHHSFRCDEKTAQVVKYRKCPLSLSSMFPRWLTTWISVSHGDRLSGDYYFIMFYYGLCVMVTYVTVGFPSSLSSGSSWLACLCCWLDDDWM